MILVVSLYGLQYHVACHISVYKRPNKERKSVPVDFVNRSDVELATLRELPRVATQQTNALYAIK